MNIRPIHSFYQIKSDKQLSEKPDHTSLNRYMSVSNFELRAKFNDHLLSFKAQVDKGLERFYETNKDRMPNTVRRYIDSLDDKSRLTPLDAQKRAFYKLEDSKTIHDIKHNFPDEELFFELKEASKTKATRGILLSVKENEELLSLSDQGILKDKSDITVYLVKKIFLEGKTIDEINNDLENDLDEDFKADFKFKTKDKETESRYIYSTTLKALGIKMPAFEYQQSLRYTREGYSDQVAQNISKGLRDFWDSLDDNQRTARAKKSVEKFENWWSSLSRNQILDMIADQMTTEDMLKAYKKAERAEEKLKKQGETQTEAPYTEEQTPRKHTKVGSEKLSKDELFKKWAANNLRNYQNNLTEAEKDTLHIKRMQRLTSRWSSMTPQERTDYISKMKAGSEPLRYTMIDAWNHSKNLIKDLSLHLKANQVHKPSDLLYSTQAFSEFQSQVMTEFWEKHPDYAVQLGQNIIRSQEKINTAISRGTFEELKKEIMRDKNQRVKEIERFKTQQLNDTEKAETPDYIKDFKEAYFKSVGGKVKSVPKEHYDDFLKIAEEKIPETSIRAWTKHMKGENITPEDETAYKKILEMDIPEYKRICSSLESALADAVYNATKDPSVYEMFISDLKSVMYRIERGEQHIRLKPLTSNKEYELYIKNPKINTERLQTLYKYFKQDMHELEVESILDRYFDTDTGDTALNDLIRNSSVPIHVDGFDRTGMKEYLSTYGNSLSILFSEKSAYPKDVKKAFYQKIKDGAPDNLKDDMKYCFFDKPNAFEKEERIKRICFLFGKRFDFVPRYYMDNFVKEMTKDIRNVESMDLLDTFEQNVCVKRKSPNETHKLAILPKKRLCTEAQLSTLTIEQALADVLYDATGNLDVYSMEFEELCDNIEIFTLVKKFPSESRSYVSKSLSKPVTVCAKRRINLANIEKKVKEYNDEIHDWLQEETNSSDGLKFQDLLFILNPDENMPEKDEAVSSRMKKYSLNLK